MKRGSRVCALVGSALLMALWAQLATATSPDHRLADAVKRRDTGATDALLKQRADVNGAQGDGSTALHWAAHWGDLATVDRLLGAGARPDAADDHGVTPLALAATNGSALIVKRLLDAGANPNAQLDTGETPFMRAIRSGKIDAVLALIDHGANVNVAETWRHQSALMWAVAANHLDIVRVLVEHGADVKARSAAGFTPLLFAAQQGNLDVARMLVTAGADVNDSVTPQAAANAPVPNNPRARGSEVDGSTVLQLTIDSGFMITARLAASGQTVASGFNVSTGHESLALFLLEKGANPNKNGAGRTALHSAVRAARPELVKALLTHGADPNSRLQKPLPRLLGQITGDEIIGLVGTTPFWLASSYADVPLMKMLHAAGGDPVAVANDHSTPLMVAAGLGFGEGEDRYGHRFFGDITPMRDAALAATRLALELGGNVNAVNDNGRTALHAAAFMGGTELAQLLIDHGADPNVVDRKGETPLSICNGIYRDGGYIIRKDTAEVLLKGGADPRLGINMKRPSS